MRVLIIAATPPPHHGQAYMTQLLLDELAKPSTKHQAPSTTNIHVRHLNSAISTELADLGKFSLRKIIRLLTLFIRALLLTTFWKPHTLYYVPANGLRSQVWRDWLLFGIPRRLVRRSVLHWHGLGLKPLYEGELKSWEQSLTRWALGRVDCSIILTEYQRQHVDWLEPRQIAVIPNGIPDPCPDFETTVLPERQKRLQQRLKALQSESRIQNPESSKAEPKTPVAPKSDEGGKNQERRTEQSVKFFKCLFLAHCTEEKGLFDALDAIALTNQELRTTNQALRVTLSVCGQFVSEEERLRFDDRISKPDLNLDISTFPHSNLPTHNVVSYAGYVSGPDKDKLLRKSDCLLFPTRWENCPLSVIEAWAYGMPVCLPDIMGLKEICPENYAGLAKAEEVDSLAATIQWAIAADDFTGLRDHYRSHFQMTRHANMVTEVLRID